MTTTWLCAAASGDVETVAASLAQARTSGTLSALLCSADAHGETALHWAAIRCHADVVHAILGAPPEAVAAARDARNIGGQTALHFAADGRLGVAVTPATRDARRRDNLAIVRALLDAGWRADARDATGSTPRGIAATAALQRALAG